MNSLTFAALRHANMRRLPQLKNRRGEPAHSEPDGSDWALSAWCNAVTGELGELANLIKKVERGDFTLEEGREQIANELADVQTYLDVLAFRCGVDLGQATVGKFNQVSDRVGCKVYLGTDEDYAQAAIEAMEARGACWRLDQQEAGPLERARAADDAKVKEAKFLQLFDDQING